MTVDPVVAAKLLSLLVGGMIEITTSGARYEELVKLFKNAEAQNRDLTYAELKPYIERSKDALEEWENETK